MEKNKSLPVDRTTPPFLNRLMTTFLRLSRAPSWLFLLLVTSTLLVGDVTCEEKFKCEPIRIPMCEGIGYNMTYMPNRFNHETQSEAGLLVHQFWPLLKIKCSADMQFFLCSLYAPICMDNYKKDLQVCRSVCERSKQGCEPLMRTLGFPWPKHMECENFPEKGTVLCMDDNSTERATSAPGSNPQSPSFGEKDNSKKSRNDMIKSLGHNIPGINLNPGGVRPLPSSGPGVKGTTDTGKDCKCSCEDPLVSLKEAANSYYNKIRTGGVSNCALNCYTPYFTEHERAWATFWVGLWSILCCISTSMTVATFFVDMKRFKYPERPIMFLSACYFMVSVGYLIRFVVGHKAVACEDSMIRYETTGPAVCTVVFLLVYFFGMASSIWWVILSFTWFLAAGLKWGQEAIASYSQYFHLAAWLIPSVKSIAVLAMSSVDGDPIAGICYVGNQSLDNLRGFVLAPLFVYLIIGISFLLAGFVSLFRIRNVIKQQGGGKTNKLERLMIRIGVFSVLYTVPAIIVIACYFYEQHLRERWETSHTCQKCMSESEKTSPNYSVFMLKYFMCLVIGTTSGFWIWSGKTVDSWRKLFNNMRCQRSNYPSRKYTNTSYQPAKQLPLSHV